MQVRTVFLLLGEMYYDQNETSHIFVTKKSFELIFSETYICHPSFKKLSIKLRHLTVSAFCINTQVSDYGRFQLSLTTLVPVKFCISHNNNASDWLAFC